MNKSFFLIALFFLGLAACKKTIKEKEETTNIVKVSDKVTDIAVGGVIESIFITSTDDVSLTGGFSIKKMNLGTWNTVPECAAVRVAVGPDGKPWVVNKSHLIFRHDGGLYWTKLPGLASDIAVGADGSAYIIGVDNVSETGGYTISKWNGSNWVVLPECAGIRIAVDPLGKPWIVNKSNLIFKENGAGLPWKQIAGKATDIGIGAEGSVYITSTENESASGYSVKKWTGTDWSTIKGASGINISVSPGGVPYWVDQTNILYRLGL